MTVEFEDCCVSALTAAVTGGLVSAGITSVVMKKPVSQL